MEFITYLQSALIEMLPTLIKEYGGEVAASDLSEMEAQVKAMSQSVGNAVLSEWMEAHDATYPADTQPCPHCQAEAKYVRRRSGTVISLLGRVRYRRSYYGCHSCGQGHYPVDEQLGVRPGEMSAAVMECAALVGIMESFETSSDLLKRLTQLELSPNSIRKASQAMGGAVEAHEARLVAESQSAEAQLAHRRASTKPARLYGSMDGFYAHLDGAWHEVKGGAWWMVTSDRQGQPRATDIRYYVDTLSAAAFSDLVWATGFEHHADQALELVFIADGAAWIWNLVEEHFPHAIHIVDWYHASAYLAPIAHAAFSDETDAQHWLDQQTDALWHGQLQAVFHACRQCLPHAPDPVRAALTFLARNRRRLRYDRFRQRGFQIGSGTMESGCKQLGAARLKIAGAQWHTDGARLVAKARAAYLSNQWDQLTLRPPPLPLIA